jgi:hypothetical protein
MKIPKSIKVGAERYSIIERSVIEDGMLNDGCYGYTLESGNLIVLQRDIPITKKQVTLLHEILHAIRMVNDGLPKPKKEDDYEEWEHYFIGLWDNNLLAVFKENPELTEWLTNDFL